MRKGRKILPYIVEMPQPYVFDIKLINEELTKNSKVIEGIKDYISHKCDVTADTEHSLSGTQARVLAGELGEHQENYSSFDDGTYNWFPVSVYDSKNKTKFDTFKSLEKDPKFDERRYTKLLSWAKGTYIEEVLNTFKNQVTRVHMRRMSPEGYLNYHMDYDTKYSIRFHIPLTTNPDCYFKFKRTQGSEEEKFHLPADGRCYFFNQGAYHSAFNEGDTDRDHFILSVNGQDDISFL